LLDIKWIQLAAFKFVSNKIIGFCKFSAIENVSKLLVHYSRTLNQITNLVLLFDAPLMLIGRKQDLQPNLLERHLNLVAL
jgi:hypothetical protein